MVIVDPIYWPPIIFELIIFCVYLVIQIQMIIKANKKKTKLSRTLTWFLGVYLIAMAMTIFTQANKNLLGNSIIPYEYITILDQVYKIISVVANWIYYTFYIEVFTSYDKEKKISNPYLIFTCLVIATTFAFLFIESFGFVVDGLILIHSMILFIPTLISSFRVYKKVSKEEKTRWAFVFVGITSILFVLLWILNLVNSLYDALNQTKYTFLFYISWSVMFLAIFTCYLGFGFPKWFSKIVDKRIGIKSTV